MYIVHHCEGVGVDSLPLIRALVHQCYCDCLVKGTDAAVWLVPTCCGVEEDKVKDLQNKWNEYCQLVHRRSPIVDVKTYQALPHLGIPYISDTACFTKSTNPLIPQSHAISVPLATEPTHRGLGSNHHHKLSKSESNFHGDLSSRQSAPSDVDIQDCRTSPSSVTSVTTELALGSVNQYSLEGKSAREGLSQLSIPRNIDESSRSVSKGQFLASPLLHNSEARDSYVHSLSLPSGNTRSGISHIELRDQDLSNMHQKFDASNCKAFYRSLVEKVGRQEEALWSISEAIIESRTNSKKHQRGAIWLNILGPDRVGKKMTAMALAELIFGLREDSISIDLAYEDDNVAGQQGLKNCSTGFWGKTMIDHIAMEISKKPLSVFLLENVDKADLLAQSSLSSAIRTGKFSDSHGREFSTNSSIFVTTARNLPGKATAAFSEKANIYFSEERIFEVRSSQMKMSIEPFSESDGFSCSPSSKVSLISRRESNMSNCPLPCSVSRRKRKLDFSGEIKCHKEYYTCIEWLSKKPEIVLDLNIPAEELNQHEEIDCNSENNSISENSQEWLEDFFDLMDKTVSFKPFDFDALADHAVREISRCFSNNVGMNCMLEIDVKIIEQILAATWLMRNTSELSGWIEQVLCKSLSELNEKYKLPDCTVVRFLAEQDLLMEESKLGRFLPSRIILE
ncbi:Chaperone protein ClpB1 [Platanthera guangdongensis]|uniref:Chaperone protein ClpB1 n=1 Tax=Platanthera guangdongensis TaxID=2320717 RepID=A0ABR2MVA6_9ASPA